MFSGSSLARSSSAQLLATDAVKLGPLCSSACSCSDHCSAPPLSTCCSSAPSLARVAASARCSSPLSTALQLAPEIIFVQRPCCRCYSSAQPSLDPAAPALKLGPLCSLLLPLLSSGSRFLSPFTAARSKLKLQPATAALLSSSVLARLCSSPLLAWHAAVLFYFFLS